MPSLQEYLASVSPPTDDAFSGFKSGLVVREQMDKRALTEQALAAQKQLQVDLGALSKNPNATAADYSSMMVKYPQLSEHFKRGWDALNTSQQQDKLGHASQVYAAITSGRNDVAVDLLTERATALRNSGNEKDAKGAETMAEFIKISPDTAKTTVGLMLASTMGPDKFAETFTKLEGERRTAGLEPTTTRKATAEATEAEAKAQSAAVAARFAESNAVKDLEKKGWDIKKVQNDIAIARENTRIAAMNSAIAREGNAIRREELKLKRDEAIQKRDDELRVKTAEVESARNSMDNFLNTAQQIINTPLNVRKAAMGPVDSRMPTIQRDVADFESLVENLDAQAFISQIPSMKGTGALSDAEGKKLSAALQSFSLKQTPEQLERNVTEAQRLILKARKNLATKYGVPDSVPDVPTPASAADIDALVAKHTR